MYLYNVLTLSNKTRNHLSPLQNIKGKEGGRESMKMRLSTVPRPIVVNFCPVDCTSKMHKKEGKKRNVKSFNTDRFMNNDLNHNLVLRRNGNTIKTTFHGARQREAVHVDVRARIQSCACTLREEGRGGGGRGLNGMHSALCVTSQNSTSTFTWEGNVTNKWALAFRL